MNAPPRHEAYVLEDDEKLAEITEDTKIPNAITVKIVKQDHTLGNMLRAQLLAMPQVIFAGYKVPHPSHPHFLLKIQTDGSIPPKDALIQASTKLIGTLMALELKFKREFSFREDDNATAGVGMPVNEDPYGGTANSGGAWGKDRDYLDF